MFVSVPAVNAKSQGNTITIHEKAQLYDRGGAMFFGRAVLLKTIFLLNLKEIVGTVIVKNPVITFRNSKAVFIKLRLYEIRFLSYNFQRPVDVLQFEFRLFKKKLRRFEGTKFRGRKKDSSVNQPR